jgi:hypothetical protein
VNRAGKCRYNDHNLCLQAGLLYRQGQTDAPSASKMDIYLQPNPANVEVRVSWDIRDGGQGEIAIIDNMGRVKYVTLVNLDEAQYQDIDLTALSTGVYHIQLRCKQGTFTRKLVFIP